MDFNFDKQVLSVLNIIKIKLDANKRHFLNDDKGLDHVDIALSMGDIEMCKITTHVFCLALKKLFDEKIIHIIKENSRDISLDVECDNWPRPDEGYATPMHRYSVNVNKDFYNIYNKYSIKDRAAYVKELTKEWENVSITFKNKCDVKLTVDGKEEDSSYDKLGFADTRQDSSQKMAYVKSWGALILFSTQNGCIKLNSFSGNKTKKETFKKDIQDLSKRLRKYFGLKDSPIIYLKDNDAYQIKIKLSPSPEFRESWQDRNISEINPKTYLNNH
ncbi:MAG: hypothetical protein WCW61_02665 [Patescibacteria group bacterium]|jgi:hypothetical protein